jgi:hypothetical protein
MNQSRKMGELAQDRVKKNRLGRGNGIESEHLHGGMLR